MMRCSEIAKIIELNLKIQHSQFQMASKVVREFKSMQRGVRNVKDPRFRVVVDPS